jgi:antitoxin component of MazEF toxin-antitoxin module
MPVLKRFSALHCDETCIIRVPVDFLSEIGLEPGDFAEISVSDDAILIRALSED